MYEARTKPTEVSFATHLQSIENPERRRDCEYLAGLMTRITGCEPRMWGPSIVGFDQYHYRYESGHQGDACVTGFASRKGDISVYLRTGSEQARALLAELGRHKLGKSCLYIRRLSDVQLPILEKLIEHSVADTRRRYPRTGM